MSPNTPPRVLGLDYLGPRRYFVTSCTYRRLNWLVDEQQARKIAQQISPFFEARGFAVLAYCLMPDHVHLLLEGVIEAANLAEAVRAWKQRTGFDWKRRTGAHLWQEGFHDRVLRAEDDAAAVVRYILENPVRAGLVSSVTDYQWTGSSCFGIEDLLASAGQWRPAWKAR